MSNVQLYTPTCDTMAIHLPKAKMAWETLAYFKNYIYNGPRKKERIPILSSCQKLMLTLVLCTLFLLASIQDDWFQVWVIFTVEKKWCHRMRLRWNVFACSVCTCFFRLHCMWKAYKSPQKQDPAVHRQCQKPQFFTSADGQGLPFQLHCKTASLWLPAGLRLFWNGSITVVWFWFF